MTHEFFQTLEQRLEPNGVVVSNLLGSIEGNNSPLVRSVYKTMLETFPVSYVFPTEEEPQFMQNIMIVSSNQPYEFDRLLLLEISKNSPIDYLSDELSRQEHFYTGIIETSDVPFLTDQYNPSEVLINPVTKKPYMQDLQENQLEEKQHLEYSMNLMLGIALTIVAGIWLLYFKKRVWN